jgi:hypothetical protein
MAFSPNFSISNNIAQPINTFVITDTSTGFDALIVDRKINVYKSDNSLFSTIDFPLSAGNTISLPILDKDYAVTIVLQWLYAGNFAQYQANQLFVFTGYLEWFFYSLVQQISASPGITEDSVFYQNMCILRARIDGANSSINVGSSVFNAQNMVSLAQNMVNNSTLFF